MRVSISSRVMPSIVVGICVGRELGCPPLTVTMPSSRLRSAAASCACALAASHGDAIPLVTLTTSGQKCFFINAYLGALVPQ